MSKWALCVGCLWLLSREAAAGSWSDYEAAGADHVCRGEADKTDAGRDKDRHAVTHTSTVEECREFCDSIKPCWGLEYDSTSQQTSYGNCEIWFTEIKAFKTSGSNFVCYRKNASTSTEKPKTVAGFTISNINVSKILTTPPFVQALSTALIPIFKNHINDSIVTLMEPITSHDIRFNLTANSVHVRLSFESSVLHPAELHNAVRYLAMTGKKHLGTWNSAMIDYSPDVMTESQSWFANQTSYITGTPAMVADYLTLASLAPALAPTPTPTPGGGGGGGASTTGKNVADDATQSARPFFLFFFWSLAQLM